MSRKVFRYGPMLVTENVPHQINMPVNAKIVHVGSKSHGYVDIWAIVNEDATEQTTTRTFQIFPTGHPIPEDAQYIGTTVHGTALAMQNGSSVWHLFERLAD